MIRGGFLSAEDRKDLRATARDGSSLARFARRANAIILLVGGRNCAKGAKALLLDDDTIRTWHGIFMESGFVARAHRRQIRHKPVTLGGGMKMVRALVGA
jgi:hypothetical protein